MIDSLDMELMSRLYNLVPDSSREALLTARAKAFEENIDVTVTVPTDLKVYGCKISFTVTFGGDE